MKKVLVILLTLAMLFSVAACGTDTPDPPVADDPGTQPQDTPPTPDATPPDTPAVDGGEPVDEPAPLEPVALNIAYMPNYAALWAVVTGINRGYFEEQAISITLYEFADGPTSIAAMESGSIDFAYIGPGAHRLCSTGNAFIFTIQQLGNADCVIGLSSAGVNSLGDLAGKRVAYSSGTSSEAILNLALDKAGLTWDDITAFDMDTSSMVASVISGSVDAAATWSPNSLVILSELAGDAAVLASNIDFSDVAVSPASWVVTPSYAAENEEIMVRFVKALYKAMDFGSQEQNFEQVATWVAEQYGASFDTAFDQRGDGAWFNGSEVVEMAQDGTLIAYYTLQQQNFIEAEAVDPETALSVTEFLLTDIMIQAGEVYN